MRITIQSNTIKAIAMFAGGKNEIRKYLQGVLIETGPKGIFAVATNGHCLAVTRLSSVPHDYSAVIIPNETIASAVKATKLGLFIDFDMEGEKRIITISTIDAQFRGLELEGRFPDWRRVLRVTNSGEKAHYCPEYVTLVDKAGKVYRPTKGNYYITQDGDNAGHCAYDDAFQVVVMPMRADKIETKSTVSWIDAI